MKTSGFLIVVPAYNEAASLPAVVAELRAECPDASVLVVDDGSTDQTPEVIRRLGVETLRLPVRLGTGCAVRTGLIHARTHGHDLVVRVDGDGQHPAAAIEALVDPIRRGESDVAVGSRYIDAAAATPASLRELSHHVLGSLLSVVTGSTVSDPTSGLWAFGSRAIRMLADHHPPGYPEPELRLLLDRRGFRTIEVPVSMRPRLAGRSSITPRRAGVAGARLLVSLVASPLKSDVGPREPAI